MERTKKMKEVKIKDISYEDFIDEDKIFTLMRTYHISDSRNPFLVLYENETFLKLSTDGTVIKYPDDDDNTFFIFDSLMEFKNFVNNIVSKDDIYVWSYYIKKVFENKEEFENLKKSNNEAVSFFDSDKVYRVNLDMSEFNTYIVHYYFREDLLVLKESLNYIRDIYETGEIEPYTSKSTYIEILKETIYDFKNLLKKMNSLIVDNRQTSIIDYVKRYVEDIDYDDLLDNYELALEIANELKVR